MTGCSGGGKSTLCRAMAARGWRVGPEAGRQIVTEQLASGGQALPWTQPGAFVAAASKRHAAQMQTRRKQPSDWPIVTDRSLLDLAAFLRISGLPPMKQMAKIIADIGYGRQGFYVPPWPELFETTRERPKSFEEAVEEHEAVLSTYRQYGFELVEIPRLPIAERIAFVENHDFVQSRMPKPGYQKPV